MSLQLIPDQIAPLAQGELSDSTLQLSGEDIVSAGKLLRQHSRELRAASAALTLHNAGVISRADAVADRCYQTLLEVCDKVPPSTNPASK